MNLDLCAIFLLSNNWLNIHNIKVIEDAACAFGIILARQEGRYIWVYLDVLAFIREKFSPQEREEPL